MERGIYEIVYSVEVPAWIPRFIAVDTKTEDSSKYTPLWKIREEFIYTYPDGTVQTPLHMLQESQLIGDVSSSLIKGLRIVSTDIESIKPSSLYLDELILTSS